MTDLEYAECYPMDAIVDGGTLRLRVFRRTGLSLDRIVIGVYQPAEVGDDKATFISAADMDAALAWLLSLGAVLSGEEQRAEAGWQIIIAVLEYRNQFQRIGMN